MCDSDVNLEIENKEEVWHNMEEIDIYADILTDQDSHIKKLKEKVKSLSAEKNILTKNLNSLQQKYEDLVKKSEDLEEKYKTVSYNASALFKTATAEIERKNETIKNLRREQDNLLFRKTRSRAVVRAQRFIATSPMKSSTPKKAENREKGLIKEEEDTFVAAQDTPRNIIEDEIGQLDKGTSNSENCRLSKISNDIRITDIPPSIQAPITTYSRRLYKKLHGVSPQKLPLSMPQSNLSEKLVGSNIDHIAPVKVESNTDSKPASRLNSIKEEITNKNETHIESKFPCRSLKLKQEVMEYIKLGPTTPSQSTSTNANAKKISPNDKTKINLKPLKNEQIKQNSTILSSPHQLILQCDLRMQSNAKGKIPSPNSVSINETIENIIKNHKAGLYDNTVHISRTQSALATGADTKLLVNSEHINESLQKTDKSISSEYLTNEQTLEKTEENKPNRLLAKLNKRMSNKLAITPVTFGKLVTSTSFQQNESTNSKPKTTEKEQTEVPRKRKLSDVSNSTEDTLSHPSQRPKLLEDTRTDRKNKFLSSLFGESPLKSNSNGKINESTVDNKPNDVLKSTSTINQPSFPIFPSSPSLDSDNPEDLVIDTTVCSQNTSPRVSESSQKEGEVEKENVLDVNKEHPKSKSEQQINNCKNECTSFAENKNIKEKNSEEIQNTEDELKHNGNECVQTEKESTVVNIIHDKKGNNIISDEDCPEKKGNGASCLPDLSECLSLEKANQLPNTSILGPTNILPAASPEKCPPSSAVPKTDSSEMCLQSPPIISENKSENAICISDNNIDNRPVQRFIPSPPQLTLVSAFRHSENSLFNITEDTLGFVSALTRVRDISPLRTPKKNEKTPTALHVQQKELDDNLFLKNGLSKVLTGTNICFQTNESLEAHNGQIESKFLTSKQSNLVLPSESPKAIKHIAVNCNDTVNKVDEQSCFDTYNNDILSKELGDIQSNSDFNISSKDIATSNTRIVICNQQNEFKRSRPVRCIIQSNNEIKMSTTCKKKNLNHNLDHIPCSTHSEQGFTSKDCNKEKDTAITNQCDVRLPVKKQYTSNLKKCDSELAEENNISFKNEHKQTKPITNENDTTESENKGNSKAERSLKNKENFTDMRKLKLSTISSPTSSAKNTFKRSESLKMMPKPIPKVNYDVLSKTTVTKENIKQVLLLSKSNCESNLPLLREETHRSPESKKSEALNKRNINSLSSKQSKEERLKYNLQVEEIQTTVEYDSNNQNKFRQPCEKTDFKNKHTHNLAESVSSESSVKCNSNDPQYNEKNHAYIHIDTKHKETEEGKNENTKSIQISNEIVEIKDIDQIPHILSINKKNRVSKYQSTNDVKKAVLQVSFKNTQNVSLDLKNTKPTQYENKDSLLPSPSSIKKVQTLKETCSKHKPCEIISPDDRTSNSIDSNLYRTRSPSPFLKKQRLLKLESPEQLKNISSGYVSKSGRRSANIDRNEHQSRSARTRFNLRHRSPSHSPDQSYSRRHIHASRTRSSHRSRRSRSVSPYTYERNRSKPYYQEYRKRKNDRYHLRRSKSRSPHRSRHTLKSRSPERTDDQINYIKSREMRHSNEDQSQTKMVKRRTIIEDITEQNHVEKTPSKEMSYNDELERVKKELEEIKRKLNTNNTISSTESLPKENIIKNQSNCKDAVAKWHLEPIEPLNKSPNVEKTQSNNIIETKCVNECLNNSNHDLSSKQNCKTPDEIDHHSSSSATTPMKIIKIHRRRRVINLGDSDVRVVSSSNDNNRTAICDFLTASKSS